MLVSSLLLVYLKGRSPGRLEQFSCMQAWCSGIMDSLGYIQYLLDLRGTQQVVTDLFVRLIYNSCVILPARLWSRSFIVTWAMDLD